MNIHRMLAATQRGLGQLVARPAREAKKEGSGVRRILSGTQRGLGGKVASPVTPTSSAAEASPVTPASSSTESRPLAASTSPIPASLESVKVVMATGLYKTAAGAVGKRAIEQNERALRGYLCVGLRDADASLKALAGIEDAVTDGTSEEMAKGPTQRAGLFLAARNLIEYERLFGDGTAERPSSAVPWEPTPPGRIDGWGRALDEIRYGLSADELEILMLRYAAGLNVTELGYVLAAPRADVERRLEMGLGYVRFLLEDTFGECAPDVDEILADAFRIEEPTDAQIVAARPKVVPLPAGTLLGDRYEIEGKLGGGEFAYVYRARDVRVPGHVVALKLLHRRALTPAAREGALRELSLIASAFHPSIVQFKDHGWHEERLWFVMPFYEGEMLLDRIQREPLPVDEALAHFERLARGLAALHAAGIRHQDVKPENIFLVHLRTGAKADRPEVFPVLLDLGVAAPSGEMALAGTPMFFAPEVAGRIFDESHEVPLTAKADVFALALSLLHSIEEPDLSDLDGVEVETFLRRRAMASPAGPRDRRLAFLKASFSRWLAKSPTDRPTAGELADELQEIRDRRSPRSRTWTPPRRLVELIGVAALAALVLAAALVVDDRSAPASPPASPPTTAPAPAAPEAHARPSPAAPLSESATVRLLERRLADEQRRAMELEDELSQTRREQLGLHRRD